ncbi:DNA-binding protein [Cytobacillus oceanisediminis]|uniref:DNA-binding protein n=1 Tax=Cytobacillus oceanisediminis TaxID=665099 RepID=UPI0023DB1494|nr:DNA-binding protein [Cytobacillus oceanisediminis]MDF2036086.1 DNA-binding protein [Cytobacillus oceanisediminis]
MTENNLKESGFPEKLAKPAVRALEGAGYFSLEQLARATEAELLELHGMGPNALGKLRRAMADRGWSFKV